MKFTDENRIEILGKLLDDKKHHEEMNFKQFYENALEKGIGVTLNLWDQPYLY